MIKIVLFVPALLKGSLGAVSHALLACLLLTACTRDRRTASYYNPCEQMKVEAEMAEELKVDVRELSRKAYLEPAPEVIEEDTAVKVTAESMLVRKEDLLALTLQAMQQNAQACASRSHGYDAAAP